MRILHVSTRLILGGSQENTVLSCEGQARLGHEVHLAFGPIYGPEGSLLERVEGFGGGTGARGHGGTEGGGSASQRGTDGQTEVRSGGGAIHPITTHVVPSLVRPVNPVADIRAYFQLRRLIREVRPDIVHTHSSKAGILARAAAWAEGRRQRARGPEGQIGGALGGGPMGIVHTIHGPPFHAYQNRFVNFMYTIAERFAARRCHVLVSVADAMTGQYLARGIGRPGQYVTVRSGMEVRPYLEAGTPENRARVRRGLGLSEDDFVVGTVARLAELKGHDDLLDALAGDLRANPRWKLLWVGDGWWRGRLVARARGMGLGVEERDRGTEEPGDAGKARRHEGTKARRDGRGQGTERRTNEGAAPHRDARSVPSVILTGLVPPDRVPDLIAAMDILAHPSYREGLPRTVPQALLCGVCPVAYDVDGTGEVCRDGETGRLIRAGDTAALRGAVRDLAARPGARRAMAGAGRELCRSEFAAETMVQHLEQVYADAISRASKQ